MTADDSKEENLFPSKFKARGSALDERYISKLTFDGLMGKGNQLLVTQTIHDLNGTLDPHDRNDSLD